MKVSYKKLFKILIDRDLKKTESAGVAGIDQNTLVKNRKISDLMETTRKINSKK